MAGASMRPLIRHRTAISEIPATGPQTASARFPAL